MSHDWSQRPDPIKAGLQLQFQGKALRISRLWPDKTQEPCARPQGELMLPKATMPCAAHGNRHAKALTRRAYQCTRPKKTEKA